MSLFKSLYPREAADSTEDPYGFDAPYDYQPIINHFGRVAVQVDEEGYSGDSHVLYDNRAGKIGLLIFGWGSCSGCDALQACQSPDDVDALIAGIEKDIKWFNSKAEALAYITGKDWQLDFCYGDELRRFIAAATAYLTEQNDAR